MLKMKKIKQKQSVRTNEVTKANEKVAELEAVSNAVEQATQGNQPLT